ncbi:ORF101 [Saltwater crocodilepox virus]|nr:hypothetical protein [Saltwater crocodilepox virus]AVD69436.1 hypothetical protein [Saltwater crocodilepox virus]QGT46540.1 ORF101 [Saltwater crocodilepox virus]QGT46756.1 ORF101 [Saltwater crocodilepox virus]QGT46972.1 ORF101 [Saltwater crocodilepox virus]
MPSVEGAPAAPAGIDRVLIPGAVLFTTCDYSLRNYLNPSRDKHAGIYLGAGVLDLIAREREAYPVAGLDNETAYVAEFDTAGFRLLGLCDFLADKTRVKVYHYVDPAVMARAARHVFDAAGKRYGFSARNSYCFKFIADCYLREGVETARVHPPFILSQNFTDDERWTRVFDSATPGVDFLALLPSAA